MKISSKEVTLMKLKNRGHQLHITGTGIHKDKKRYTRKPKYKEQWG